MIAIRHVPRATVSRCLASTRKALSTAMPSVAHLAEVRSSANFNPISRIVRNNLLLIKRFWALAAL